MATIPYPGPAGPGDTVNGGPYSFSGPTPVTQPVSPAGGTKLPAQPAASTAGTGSHGGAAGVAFAPGSAVFQRPA